MKGLISIIVLLVFIISCESNNEKKTSGTETIYSDLIFNQDISEGFSVDEESVTKYPNSEQIIPDFKLKVFSHRDEFQVYFKTLMNKPAFVFIDSTSRSDSAQILFENFSETNYEFENAQTIPYLSVNQTWLIRGINNTYYKILILEIETMNNPDYVQGNHQLKEIGNVTFMWKILKTSKYE
jgi:hypothetical protein